MITLRDLARLATEHADDLGLPVSPWVVAGRVLDTDARPAVMGVVNLSQDSAYRESVATTHAKAVRRGLVLAAQGADVIDVGGESVDIAASRIGAADQVDSLVPVVEELSAAGVAVSVEGYEPAVVEAGLKAGAAVVNLTGSGHDEVMFDLAAAHGASVVLCHIGGEHARAVQQTLSDDPVPEMLDAFAARMAHARSRGVESLVVDPGAGFAFGAGVEDPRTRARHQSRMLLSTFRLRRLGVPVCHALPHSFGHFGEEFRTAEGFFAVLASLGGTGLYRTHEVPRVVAVLEAMSDLDVGGA